MEDPLGAENFNQPTTDKSKHILDLVISIASTLVCCFPLGIIATICAIIALVRYNHGNFVDAESMGKVARILWIITVILGLILVGIMIAIPDAWKDLDY